MTLDFTVADQRDGEWEDADGNRYRFLDRSTGTGWHRWDDSHGRMAWIYVNVIVFDGPFTRVHVADEFGEDADWNEDWDDGCWCDGECECD